MGSGGGIIYVNGFYVNNTLVVDGETLLTFTDNTDLQYFKDGDVVGSTETYSQDGQQVYYVNGTVNGRQFKTPATNPQAAFDGNSGSRCQAASPNEENGIGIIFAQPWTNGNSPYTIRLATSNSVFFVINDRWDTPIPTADIPSLPAGVSFLGNDDFDVSGFINANGGQLESLYVYSTEGTMGVNGFNNGAGWLSFSYGEVTVGDAVVIGTPTLNPPQMVVSGGSWDTSNRSQVWSDKPQSGTTYPNYSWDAVFNGTIDGSPNPDNCVIQANGTFTQIDFTEFDSISSVKVAYYGGAGGQIHINYGESSEELFDASSAGYNTHTFSTSELKNVRLSRGPTGGNFPYLYAIYVDGRLLVDPVDTSEVWSDLTTYTAGDEDPARGTKDLFDGNYDSYCYISGSEVVVTDFSSLPGGGLTVSSSIEVFIQSASGLGSATANGGATTGPTQSTGWLSIPNPPALLTSFDLCWTRW